MQDGLLPIWVVTREKSRPFLGRVFFIDVKKRP